MAVQIESQGQLQEFLGILKRRKWQVMLPAAVVLAIGIAAAVIVPKKYVARTQIELRQVGESISTKDAGTAVFQLRAVERIRRILREHQNAEFLALPQEQQGDFIKRVQSDIKVTPAPGATVGSSFVNIEYMDVSKEWALEFLNALSTDWINSVLARDRNKAQDEARKIEIERNKLLSALSALQQSISDLKSSNGISATQPAPGSGATRNEDPVFDRLTHAQTELDQAQLEVTTNQGKLDMLEKQVAALPPEVKQESLVAGASNEAELAEIEKQLDDLEKKYGNLKPAAGQWPKYKEEQKKLYTKRDEIRAGKTRATLEVTKVENPELKPKRAEIAALEQTLAGRKMAVKHLEAEIAKLKGEQEGRQDVWLRLDEMETNASRLKASLEDTEKRFNQKNQTAIYLAGKEADPFQVTEAVNAGAKPTEPNPWLIISFAFVLGLGLGLAIALVAEFSRNCFRNVADISRVMVVPVLGSVGTILTRRQKRLTLARRAVVGLSSVAFVVAILFVTWAWASHAQYISQDLRDAIEHLRSKLR